MQPLVHRQKVSLAFWQVYYIAKQCSRPCSPEEFAIALARHFVRTYPKVRGPADQDPARLSTSPGRTGLLHSRTIYYN